MYQDPNANEDDEDICRLSTLEVDKNFSYTPSKSKRGPSFMDYNEVPSDQERPSEISTDIHQQLNLTDNDINFRIFS